MMVLVDFLFGGDEGIRDQVIRECPAIPEATEGLMRAMPAFVDALHAEGTEALSAAVSQAINDLVDLLHDVLLGRGRSAIRSARSLYELLVTVYDITGSAEDAQRYVDHKSILKHQEWLLDLPESALRGNDRKAEAHRRKKLQRSAAVPYERAIKKYGSSFQRGWAGNDLASRAADHHLEGFYPFYKLASGLLHGSAGGILGQHRVIDGRGVHRVGPAIEIASTALIYGLTFFELILERMETVIDPQLVAEMSQVIVDWKRLWPDLRKVLQNIDRDLWPDHPPIHSVLLMVWNPGGVIEWYCHDANFHSVRRAQTPELDAQQSASLEEVVGEIEAVDPDHPISVGVVGVVPVPEAGSEWLSDSQFLVQEPEDGWWSIGDLNPLNPRVRRIDR